MCNENSEAKKRRRITSNKPVLVRSVKPGQALSATYSKASHILFPLPFAV